MSAISKPTAAAGSGGLTLAQLQSEAINQGELDTSLSAISQAVATLGSQLQSAGAVKGELRVFNATVAPAGWVEVDRSTPQPLHFTSGIRTQQCSPRAYIAQTANTCGTCVAGEYNGYVYYVSTLTVGGYGTTAVVERMSVSTGVTSYVASTPVASYDGTNGFAVPFATVVGDYLYTFGGRIYDGTVSNKLYRLSLLTPGAGWSQLQDMPSPGFSLGTPVVVGNKFYVVGGIGASNTRFSVVRVFDTNALAWSTLASALPYGVADNVHCALLPDGVSIVCVGGYSGSAELRKFCILNTTTGTFGVVKDIPAAWADRPRALFRIPGQSIVKGLCYANGLNSSVVEYDPATTAWIDTGVASALSGALGNLALSDGCSFIPAVGITYIMPHAKHVHSPASQSRLLCASL